MNYGFRDPEDDGSWLRPGDEPYHQHLALVRRTVAGVELAGRRVLEVGCGRGGNCSYLTRYEAAAPMVGFDLSPTNLDLCRVFHRLSGLSFSCGDAQALPFADASFDVVVNLESAHCYPDLAAFLSEVHRVLRPGGVFCLADFWDLDLIPHDWSEREAILRSAPFELEEEEDVTREVCLALGEEGNVQNLLEAATPPEHRAFTEHIAETTARVRHALLFGFASYRRWRFRKP